MTRPTWAEISRGKLARNYRRLRGLAGADAELLAVVKANAYGHGLPECATALAADGAGWFGVTCVEEGVALRRALPEARIVVMAGLWREEAEAALEHGLTPVVWERAHLEWVEAAARKLGLARTPVHVEIDTGMSRQGVAAAEMALLLDGWRRDSACRLEAAMTHFHSPEDGAATAEQMRRLGDALEAMGAAGWRPEYVSAGSSASVLLPEGTIRAVDALARGMGARAMLRPGLGLFGYAPCAEIECELEPVLSWKTRVVSLREIEAGTTAGYDATFRAARKTRLALLPVGYADGLNRLLSGGMPGGGGSVLVRGRRAAIAGRVSMDHTMVDVTEIEGVERGDEAVLIGEQGAERIGADEMAKLTGTIPWETLCAIAARVPRMVVE